MAACDLFFSELESTSMEIATLAPARGPVAVRRNAVATMKMRDMASLWNSGLRTSLLSNISDPLTDEVAELEAQKLIAQHFANNNQIKRETSKKDELDNLIQFQLALQASSRVLGKIGALTVK